MSPTTQAALTANIRLSTLRNGAQRRRKAISARRRRRRRALTAVAAILAVFAPTTVAHADAPLRSSASFIDAGCTATSAAATIWFTVSDRPFEGGATLQWWAPGDDPEEDEPTLTGHGPTAWDGTAFSGDLTLHGHEASVEATYAGTVTRTGDAMTESQRVRQGNVRMVVDYTFQDGAVEGSLEIDGIDTLHLEDCSASFFDLEQFVTWPRTSIDVLPEAFRAECALLDDAGAEIGRLWVDGDDHGLVADMVLGDLEAPTGAGFGLLDNDRGLIGGELILVDLESWEEAGSARVDLDTTVTGRRTSRHVWQNGGSRVRTVDLRLDGTVVGDGVDANVVDCAGQRDQGMERISAPQGPSHNGRTLTNDVAEGAVDLQVGSRLNTSTRTTAPEAEVPVSCWWWDPEVHASHTLWYRIDGTGNDVTIDTAGSGFNTVVAVYEVTGDELDEIACVDDVLPTTLQAAVTIATDPGTTYLVQIGGFHGQFGQLKLAIR